MKFDRIALTCSIALMTGGLAHSATSGTSAATTRINTWSSKDELRAAMRSLWEDHVVYTRSVVTSMLSDLADRDVVTARLLRNQQDIGDAIKPFYGAAAGDELARLLKEHILVAAAVVTAARSGDAAALAKAQEQWNANGVALADFLGKANPAWRGPEVAAMLKMHLQFLTRQVVARLSKNWQEDVRAYDEGDAHMRMFADRLAAGIVAQFPERFAR